MNKAHLFGYGYLKDYGEYYLVAAENIDEATELLQKEIFKDFKEEIETYKESARFENGEAINGCAELFMYCEKNGYYEMSDDELFDAFCKNEFGKSLYNIMNPNKTFKVTDLGTSVWRGESA